MKNQTGKILERYFWNRHQVENYQSVIKDEKEQIQECQKPAQEKVFQIAGKVISDVNEIILKNAEKTEFVNTLEYLDGIQDKVVAAILANMFNEKEIFQSEEDLMKSWLKILEAMEAKSGQEKNDSEISLMDIDVSKLSIGMEIKNYKVLCGLLNQSIKTGKSRKLQLEDFKRYFDWEKAGQKFIITDIYDTPLTKEDKRKFGNNSIYVKYIEVILLRFLSKQKGYTKTLTKRNWWELLGIVNKKYDKVSQKNLEDLDFTVTSWEIKHFYQRCNKKLEEILFSALNSLRSRRLITYETQTIIVRRDDNGREIYSEANDNEKKKLLDVEHYVLHSIYKYEKMVQVFLRFQQKEFYSKVNELIYERYGWNHCFKQIKIIYTPEGVKQVYPELEAKLQKEILNQKILDALDESASKTYKKWQQNYREWEKYIRNTFWGEVSEMEKSLVKKPFKPPNTYLEAQSLLKDELIRIGHKDMIFSEKEFIESNKDIDNIFESGL